VSGRQTACSAKCRAARSRQQQVEARQTRDRRVRQLIEAALTELDDKTSGGRHAL